MLKGLLLGLAVGDALGLPAEGMSRRRVRKRFRGPWRHRLVFDRGMVSDDTEHAFFVAQALLAGAEDAEAFARSLAWKLRWWLASVPAGVGLGTLRACLKLWAGFPPSRSGVRSAGSMPAIRAAVIGAYFAEDARRREAFVRTSTLLTHTDPRALVAASAVAELVALIAHRGGATAAEEALDVLRRVGRDDREWQTIVERMTSACEAGLEVDAFADVLGLSRGVSGYAYHVVPVAVYAWMHRRGDFRGTLEAVLDLGGDTDTIGAVAGALAGVTVGEEGIPDEWFAGIRDWPRSVGLLREAASRLELQKRSGRALGPVSYPWPAVPLRNVLFLVVVLLHGFGRLVPPW